ncbi:MULTISPECIES: MFS transporter [Paenibacillus]|uniref:MFS transporter n=1 Tax=Paenibacillus odorifer TaxID=189426 RepID=A0ABX3HH26_9BACL|nr:MULTISPECIES: MFS transporter [Paenibacillus]KAA1190321.1 MFS transporter [Paenibacillus sp. B2(2019)]OMD49005.1 MFS transporter [Paenibacillus odorifer]
MEEHHIDDLKESKLTANKPFMLLIAAQLVSNVGDWLHILALLTMVGFKWNATPWEITAISLCMAVPLLLGGPFAGYLSDRFNRKALMIGSDIARAAVVICLVFAGSLWQVYVLLLAKGCMDVLFSPAKSGKIKELVPAAQMDKAMALSSSIEQITKIVGPALGGLLVAAFGISVCYMIDSATFVLSAIILLGLPRTAAIKKKDTETSRGDTEVRNSFRQEMSAGLHVIAGMPVVLCGIVMLVLVLLMLQIGDSQIVTLFREIPGVNGDLLGWCVAASGFGTLLSALLVSRLGSGKHPLIFMGLGAIIMGIVFSSAGIVTAHGQAGIWMNIALFGSFMFAGVGAGLAFIPFNSMLQQRTPAEYTGRVFGTIGSLTSAAVILGPVAGGALVTASGPVSAFILSGLLTGLLGLGLLMLRGKIERRDEAAIKKQEGIAATNNMDLVGQTSL